MLRRCVFILSTGSLLLGAAFALAAAWDARHPSKYRAFELYRLTTGDPPFPHDGKHVVVTGVFSRIGFGTRDGWLNTEMYDDHPNGNPRVARHRVAAAAKLSDPESVRDQNRRDALMVALS